MEYIVITLTILLILSVWGNINQLRKQEKLEEYVNEVESSNDEYFKFFNRLKTYAGNSFSRMRQIDRRGAFESDDEVGMIFAELKEMINELYGKFE
jgi:hypothetical protein